MAVLFLKKIMVVVGEFYGGIYGGIFTAAPEVQSTWFM